VLLTIVLLITYVVSILLDLDRTHILTSQTSTRFCKYGHHYHRPLATSTTAMHRHDDQSLHHIRPARRYKSFSYNVDWSEQTSKKHTFKAFKTRPQQDLKADTLASPSIRRPILVLNLGTNHPSQYPRCGCGQAATRRSDCPRGEAVDLPRTYPTKICPLGGSLTTARELHPNCLVC
jgi:hypothetical protein